ncbi:hypothetical protein BJ878DRAFT_238657 [Calycina marina]|uniref:Uncharacterized protein n=1 Tax=Calycina marina TaxID=1763456 RepID=A0A9P7Z8P7_9HELO|nr:hypothetical protein BJ878DRAFT_238657 [Calycina marina]
MKPSPTSLSPSQRLGQASFILVLFHMIELDAGIMPIDNINLARKDIRAHLNVISQDPYFIAGSIRLSFDPYSGSSGVALLTALQKAQLDATITVNGGPDAELDIETLSHGQWELSCLGCAMLRKSRFIVFHEAISSVNRKTDALMQRITHTGRRD